MILLLIILVRPIPVALLRKTGNYTDRVVGKWELERKINTKARNRDTKQPDRGKQGGGKGDRHRHTQVMPWIGQAEANSLIFAKHRSRAWQTVQLSVPRITHTRAGNQKRGKSRRKRCRVFCFSGSLGSFLSQSMGFG